MPHLIQRVAILGTGLIGGSFAKALRKYTPDMIIAGWDREEVAHQTKSSGGGTQTKKLRWGEPDIFGGHRACHSRRRPDLHCAADRRDPGHLARNRAER